MYQPVGDILTGVNRVVRDASLKGKKDRLFSLEEISKRLEPARNRRGKIPRTHERRGGHLFLLRK